MLKNPFEAAAGKSSKLSKTVICTKVSHPSLQNQDDAKSNLSVIQSNSDSSDHGHGAAKPKNPFEANTDELSHLSDAGNAELLRTEVIELREPYNPETMLLDGSGLSVCHPCLSIKCHFNESDDERTSETSSNNRKQKQSKVETRWPMPILYFVPEFSFTERVY